jgi:hypothetical protein
MAHQPGASKALQYIYARLAPEAGVSPIRLSKYAFRPRPTSVLEKPNKLQTKKSRPKAAFRTHRFREGD